MKGHGLLYEGRPVWRKPTAGVHGHEVGGGTHWWLANPAGTGIGVCRCGATSPVLPSNAARKRWHAEHKTDAVEGGKR